MRSPASILPTYSRQATALPPLLLISSTTSWAGPASPPLPSIFTPGSTTTTLAPWAAMSMAMPLPMPRPEPVTIAVLPSSHPPGISFPFSSEAAHGHARDNRAATRGVNPLAAHRQGDFGAARGGLEADFVLGPVVIVVGRAGLRPD